MHFEIVAEIHLEKIYYSDKFISIYFEVTQCDLFSETGEN